MNVRFLRVIGTRAHNAAIVAHVDNVLVKWNPGPGWVTECRCPEDEDCAHIDAVFDLLDHRVLGDVG